MAQGERKELEDELVEVAKRLATPPSDVEDLFALLDEAEGVLRRVDQSPSQSMSAALYPVMKALVAKELLEYPDTDVKVAVASCFSEVTRITAPVAPYGDDLMKEIFQMIVDTFEKLDDVSSRLYHKRVSILETVAKVRSCVIMLDIECDTLIVQMFKHFLKTIRSDHSNKVLSSLETIMRLVIKESEYISSELLRCLLACVKRDNKDHFSAAYELGEKVIGDGCGKLKPYLVELIQSTGTPYNDYSNLIASICQDNSDNSEQTEVNVSDECMADDSKLSERRISDELLQESEVGCVEELATTTDMRPKPVTHKCSVLGGTAESVAAKSGSVPDHNTKKSRGRMSKSSVQLIDTRDDSRIDSEKIWTGSSGNVRGKASDSFYSNVSLGEAKAALSLEPKEKAGLQLPAGFDRSLPDTVRRTRGRSQGSKVMERGGGLNAAKDHPISPSVKKGSIIYTHQEETWSSKDCDPRKEYGSINNLEGKPARRLRNKACKEIGDDSDRSYPAISPKEVNVKSDTNAELLRQTCKKGSTGKPNEQELSGKQEYNGRQQKTKGSIGKDEAEELSPKISVTPNAERQLDETLVGSKIKVWWPDDKKFYNGIVHSFNPASEKHKIVYDDGDIEILFLKNERWELIEDRRKRYLHTDTSSKVTRKRKANIISDLVLKDANAETPVKSGDVRMGKSTADGTDSVGKKHRNGLSKGRRGSGLSNLGRVSKNSPKPVSKGTSARKLTNDVPRMSSEPEDEFENSEDDSPKPGSKFEENAFKVQGNSMDEDSETGIKTKDDLISKSKDYASKISSRLKDETIKTGKSKEISERTSTPEEDAIAAFSEPISSIAKVGSEIDEDSIPRTAGESDLNGLLREKSKVQHADVSGDLLSDMQKPHESESINKRKLRRKT